MTKQHPLTDDIICTQGWGTAVDFGIYYDEDSLRAATDWQLEQVIDWLKDNVSHSLLLEAADKVVLRLDLDWITDDLKQAMRPQENN